MTAIYFKTFGGSVNISAGSSFKDVGVSYEVGLNSSSCGSVNYINKYPKHILSGVTPDINWDNREIHNRLVVAELSKDIRELVKKTDQEMRKILRKHKLKIKRK